MEEKLYELRIKNLKELIQIQEDHIAFLNQAIDKWKEHAEFWRNMYEGRA